MSIAKLRFIGHAYQPHPLVLSAHVHNLAEYVGNGCQQAHVNHYSTTALISVQIDTPQDADAAHGVCALESSI